MRGASAEKVAHAAKLPASVAQMYILRRAECCSGIPRQNELESKNKTNEKIQGLYMGRSKSKGIVSISQNVNEIQIFLNEICKFPEICDFYAKFH